MSIYDIIMLVVFVGSILFGLWKGLAWQVASLGAIFVSYFVALNFSGPLSAYISASEPWNRFAAMLLLYVGTSLIIWVAYGYLKSSIERMHLRGFDTQAGGIVGAIKGLALCMVVTLFSVTIFGEQVGDYVIESRSGGYLAAGINQLNMIAPGEFQAVLDKHVQKFNKNLAEQDENFLKNSTDKLNDKIQTIRGHFKVPGSSDGTLNNQVSPVAPRVSGGNSEGAHVIMPGRENSGDVTTSNELGRRVLDTAKEIVEEQLNR